jgi:hypothetical protein
MTYRTPVGERPRGARIDDRRPAHISASPETDHFRPVTTAAPCPARLAGASPASVLLRTLAPIR